jgi:hypothetical protein
MPQIWKMVQGPPAGMVSVRMVVLMAVVARAETPANALVSAAGTGMLCTYLGSVKGVGDVRYPLKVLG